MEEKRDSWFSNHSWILPLGIALLVFIGMALPLVQAHTVTYDPETWTFGEGPRESFGAGIMFGIGSAVAWPYLAFYGLVLIGVLLIVIGAILKDGETFVSISMFLFLIASVFFFLSNSAYGICNAMATVGNYRSYFGTPGTAEFNGNYYWYIKEYVALADGRLGVGAILSGALSALACFTAFSFSMSKRKLDIRSMTEIAMLSAIAIVLDVIFHYIPSIPGQVGSISVALVPIFIIALRHGPARGFLAASFIYGLITCFTDGYGLWLYPLDYFVAYSGVAIIGFFAPHILGKDQKTYNVKGILLIFLGCLLGGVVRFIGSASSSMVNYGYSFTAATIANLYAFFSAFACAVVLSAFYGPLLRLNRRFPIREDRLSQGE